MARPGLFRRNDAAVERSTTIETYMTPANSKVAYNDRLLLALEKMLAIEVIDVKAALTQTSVILAEATNADKIDIFMFEPSENTLVAMGISPTPMAKRQKQLGLTRLPLANGGREAEVYRTGVSYFSGNVDLDSE